MIRTEDIIAATAEHYGVDVRYMMAGSRRREHVYPRHVAIAVTRRMTKLSMPQIGVRFGHREHTTILHALRRVAIREREDPATAEAMATIAEAAQRRFDCRRYKPLLELVTALAGLWTPIPPVWYVASLTPRRRKRRKGFSGFLSEVPLDLATV